MSRRAIAVLAVGLTVTVASACGSPPQKDPEERPVGEKKPFPKLAFTRGPALAPKSALVDWLEAQRRDGKPLRVRLPVAVTSDVLGVRSARAGEGSEALALKLDDTRLGVSLHDHVRHHFPAGSGVMRLIGTIEDARAVPARFQVHKVEGPVKDGEGGYAEVEARSP